MKRLPMGLVVHDIKGTAWVYLGFRITSVGSVEHRFHVGMPYPRGYGPDYEYRAVRRETLIRKFPDLAEHWPEPVEAVE